MKLEREASKVVILEELPSISVDQLMKLFLMQRVGERTKQINLISQDKGRKKIIGSLLITVHIEQGNDYLILDYEVGAKEIRTRIDLKAIESHLGKWYKYSFLCRVTRKSVKRIYLDGYHFISRHAIKNPYYRKQLETKKKRNNLWRIRKVLKLTKLVEQAENNRVKKWYGFPTRKQEKAQRARKILQLYTKIEL